MDELLHISDTFRKCTNKCNASSCQFHLHIYHHIYSLFIAVDLTDSAIRHENGKQVARWNVDPSKFATPNNHHHQHATTNDHNQRPSSSSSGGSAGLPSHLGGYILQTPINNGVHPAANRNQGYTTSTPGQHPSSSRHQPNGKDAQCSTKYYSDHIFVCLISATHLLYFCFFNIRFTAPKPCWFRSLWCRPIIFFT